MALGQAEWEHPDSMCMSCTAGAGMVPVVAGTRAAAGPVLPDSGYIPDMSQELPDFATPVVVGDTHIAMVVESVVGHKDPAVRRASPDSQNTADTEDQSGWALPDWCCVLVPCSC
jgi:hypothetical protein